MDYFDEMGWQPIDATQTQDHQLLLVARFLQDNGFINEEMYADQLAPPASREIVDNLPDRKVSKSDEKCAICLKPNEDNEIFKVLPCLHAFHPNCILPWLNRTNSCPLCRYEMKTDNADYEEMKKRRLRDTERLADIDTLHNSMFG